MAEQRQDPRGTFQLKVSADDPGVAYLRLPTHRGGETKMSRSVRVADLLGMYAGPDGVLDFDARGVLVGIEIS